MSSRRRRLRRLWKSVNRLRPSGRVASHPLFIFGEMRSGTNMLLDALDRHGATECYNEGEDEAFVDYVLKDQPVLRSLIEGSNANWVVFKSTADLQRAPEILEDFEGSRGLWIYRHYSDVVNSAVRKWTEHNDYLAEVLYDPESADWRATNLDDETLALLRHHHDRGLSVESARALIWYYRNEFYFRAGVDARDDVLLVRYESLVEDPVLHLRRACEFLELESARGIETGISRSSVGKEEEPEVDGEIRELCDALYARLDAEFFGSLSRWNGVEEAPRVAM